MIKSVLKVLLRIISYLSQAAAGFGLILLGVIGVLWLMREISLGDPEISDALMLTQVLFFRRVRA